MSNAVEPQPAPTHPALGGTRAGAPCPDRPSSAEPDGLRMCLNPREGAVDLELVGDLDIASTPRFMAAMEWVRRRFRKTIVVDTRGLTFVDLHGYRAFHHSIRNDDGSRDPRVVYLTGQALDRIRHFLAALGAIPTPRLS